MLYITSAATRRRFPNRGKYPKRPDIVRHRGRAGIRAALDASNFAPYTPQDMGHFAVYTSLLGMFGAVTTLCYELAIPLPANSRHAAMASVLAIGVAFVTSLAAAALLSVHQAKLLLADGRRSDESRYGRTPGLFLTGVSTVLTLNTVRYQTYRKNAISKGLQGSVQAVSQVTAGFLRMGWLGLMGQIHGIFAGNIAHAKFEGIYLRRIEQTPHAAAAYGAGAKVSALSHCLRPPRTRSTAPPATCEPLNSCELFWIAGGRFLRSGLSGLEHGAVSGPIAFSVFLGGAAEAARQKRLDLFVDRVYRFLIAAAFHAFIPIAILARPVFSMAFGKEWEEAGAYVKL